VESLKAAAGADPGVGGGLKCRDQVHGDCASRPRRYCCPCLHVRSLGVRSPWDLGLGGIAVGRPVPAAEARELKDGVDGGFEGAGVALNLGEDEAALERGEQGDGEVVRVGAVREVPGGVQTAQPVADGGRPLPESGRDQGAGLGVGLGQLPGE
jgi:hypothetical protein